MRIQHNIMAMSAYRNYTNNTSALSKNLEKLSSGYKINRAGDDAAGLAISEKMRAQLTGLKQAQANAKSGINLVQTAEGALTEVHDMLNRMVKLADQSANGTYDDGVDRVQLQKELNQLRSEVDRIADASNFNGIKLLDGSLGLNKEAFEITSAAATEATGGDVTIANIAKGNEHLETSGNNTAVGPEFAIDLTGMKFTATDTGSVKLSVLGTEITIATNTAGGTAGVYEASNLATALKTALQSATGDIAGVETATGTASSTATANDGVKIGDMVFTVGGTGSSVTFTYAGYMKDGTTYTPTATDDNFTEAQAKAINDKLGGGVSVGAATNGTVNQNNNIHDTTGVKYAQAISSASYAGVDIDLSSIVKQGGTLTIDGKEFVFKTKSDALSNAGSATVIDVSKGKDAAEQIHMAVDQLSQQAEFNGEESRKWKISSAGSTKIHIDQTAASATGKELKTSADVLGVLEATTPTEAAKNVGTSIKITDSKIKAGDTLTIGEGDNAKKYVFTDKASDVPEGAIQVKITGGAAKNLQALISGSEINDTGDTVTIRAAAAGDNAPTVLGKGLTLQIGDTSDSYNQLNVSVKNMKCDALGIGKADMNIDTQEHAADAVKKLTNAINQVSDMRGTLGATQNRLDHTINNLSVMEENIQDAESNIRDVDVAEEMMAYTKNNILVQSAQAMLAQANQVPQGVLQLLQ